MEYPFLIRLQKDSLCKESISNPYVDEMRFSRMLILRACQ